MSIPEGEPVTSRMASTYTSSMTELLGDCPRHGIVNVRSPFDMVSSIGVRISNSMGICTICGASSALIDGEYSADSRGNATATRLMPTPSQLRRLEIALRWGQEALQASEDAASVRAKLRRTVEREAPALGSFVDAALGTKGAGAAAWIAILLAVVQMMLGSQSHDLSPEDVVKIIDQTRQHELSNDESPSLGQSPTKPLSGLAETASGIAGNQGTSPHKESGLPPR